MTNFTHYSSETAPDNAREMLTNIRSKYGFVPNLFSYMAEAPTTLEAYLTLNELVSNTSFTPAQQQVALLAVSVENDCNFCIAAHRAFGKMHKVDSQTMDSILTSEEADDLKDRALIKFTKSAVKNRGRLKETEITEFIDAGFTKKQILEVILVVTIKTLSNYINHLTKPEPNAELLAMI